MPEFISSRKGRLTFMALIIVGAVGALVLLESIFGDGGVSSKNYSSAFFKLLNFYFPLLSLILAFYFKENLGGTSFNTPFETFIVALLVLLGWLAFPLYILYTKWFIEEVLDYFDKFIPIGQSFVLLALGYYFAKGPKEMNDQKNAKDEKNEKNEKAENDKKDEKDNKG